MARDFHQRFDIQLPLKEAEQRFLNRVQNEVFDTLLWESESHDTVKVIERQVVSILGERYYDHKSLGKYVGDDFYKCLLAIETLSRIWKNKGKGTKLAGLIEVFLANSETDLEITWEEGKFRKKGAAVLDERLVNDPLQWLRSSNLESVVVPFEKALRHLLETERRPELAADVITDAYEAVEAMAKIITGRPNKELTANAELFLSKMKVSDSYRKILKDYVTYANEFRHAAEEGRKKQKLSYTEAESFVYLTGIFLRFASRCVQPG